MFDCLYLRKYIAPKSTRITEILAGFRKFHDELLKYKEEIEARLPDYPHIRTMCVNDYNLDHVGQILKGNILEKTLNKFSKAKE